MKTPHIQSRSGQDGMSATLLIVVLAPLLLLGGVLLTLTVAHKEEGMRGFEQDTARLTSVSGAQDALGRLAADETFTGAYELPMEGGLARVSVEDWSSDGLDNDGDGFVDDPGEDNFRTVQSTGWVNAMLDTNGVLIERAASEARVDTRVVVEKIDLNLAFSQSIYLDDPNARINLDGGAFILSGDDYNVDGSSGSETPKPAIGVNGDPAGILAQIAPNQRSKITGSLPDPAVGQTAPLDADDFAQLIEPYATRRFDGIAETYSGPLGDLNTLAGEIVYAKGNLKLHGQTTGAGILFVEGDLTIDGNFSYAGVVFVKGSVYFKGGGGNKELQGSLLVWGDSQLPDDLGVAGSVQVNYSSQAVNTASVLPGYAIRFWVEQ